MFHPEPDILKDCDLLFFVERFSYTQNDDINPIDINTFQYIKEDKRIVIDIVVIKEKYRKCGVCRGILRYLQRQGINVSVTLSTIEAYDFWKKMHKQGLINAIPEKSMDRKLENDLSIDWDLYNKDEQMNADEEIGMKRDLSR